MKRSSQSVASLGLFLTILCCQGTLARVGFSRDASSPPFASWTFQENFSHGIPGWISYPLVQDEGYDPSLYTATVKGTSVLVRDVVARGQRILRVGMLRALRFRATPFSSFEASYAVGMCGQIIRSQMILVAADDQKYIVPIPSGPGIDTVRISGKQFSLPPAGVTIDAIVVEADAETPLLGSHNRLTLESFKVEAEKRRTLPLKAPQLETSRVSGAAVARGVFSWEIPVELADAQSGDVSVYNGNGRWSAAQVIGRGGASSRVNHVALSSDTSPPPGLWSADVRNGSAERKFRFLVLGKIPPHPRILLTAGRIAELRSQMDSNVLLKIMSQKAAQLGAGLAYNPKAGVNIALLSPVSVFPGLTQYFQLMENYGDAIAFNALDYKLSGDTQALERARKALDTVSEWSTWTPPWFLAHGLQTYYEVGVFTQRVALGYDLIADQLSPDEKSRIADSFWRNSIQPSLEDYFFNDRLPTASSNHMANSVGGAIAACVALYGDIPAWNARFGTALAELITAYENLLQGLFPGDGSEAEPAGYENFAMEGMSWGGAALQALGIRPRGMNRMMQAFWWLRYAEFKPGMFLDTGDFGTSLSALSGYAWPAENAGSPALRAFYESARNSTMAGLFRLRHTGRALEEAPGLLDLVCCTRPTVPVSNPPSSRIFRLRGSAVLRSGWEPSNTVVSIRVGPWFNHEHHDQGSFRAAFEGEELITEAGYADYYKDPCYADYFTQAPGHSTVVADGDPFSQEDYDGRYWPALRRFARFRDHVFSSGIDYLRADLAPAYNDGGNLNQYSREYVFIKPGILIVHDHLQSTSPHRYTFFLHVPPGSRTTLDHARAIIHGKSAFAALTAGAAGRQWTLEAAPVPENAYINLDRDAAMPRQTLRLDSSPETIADFFVTMHFQKANELPAPLVRFRTISGFGFKSARSNVEVLFRMAPARLVSRNTAFGDVISDGDAVAICKGNGITDVLAVRTGGVRIAKRLLFSAEPSASKVDLIVRQSLDGEEVHVSCLRETNLQIGVERHPVSVTLDGSGISLLLSNGFVSIPRLGQGEHVVEIKY
jgi:hypothetical protein